MPQRTKLVIVSVVLAAGYALVWASRFPSDSWLRFSVFLVAILASSGMKVILPQGESSMSLNFPFILLAVIQLSPGQAILLAALSVAAQCRLRVKKLFTLVQITFNIANSVSATAIACAANLFLLHHHTPSAPALALASVAYFFASTVPVATVIATSTSRSPLSLWRAEFPWYLPFYFVGAILASLADAIGLRYGSATSLLVIPLVYTMYRAYNAQVIQARERQQHLDDTEALHLRTIEGLAMAIEAKDQETHDHLFRVRAYVTAVAEALQLPKLQLQALHTAAFLHDIGKLAVPEHIINKPGKLTQEEFEKMKIHPAVGADILDRVRFPYPVVPIVRSHHEWWNGMGYPDGLAGEAIPIGARILTVVDCFDALTSDRPYRKGKSFDDAMAIVQSLSGTQFDPAIVEVFQQHCRNVEVQTRYDDNKEFVPLKKEIDVWRGAAPGAGFEEQNTTLPPTENHDDQPDIPSQLIATASYEAASLFELTKSLGPALTLEAAMAFLAVRLRTLIPFDTCALYLKHENTVVLRHIHGEDQRCFSAQPIPMGDGISGWAAQSGKPSLNGNAAVEPSYHPRPGQPETLRAALAIPLFDLDRNVFGTLTLYAFAPDSFSKAHLRTLQVMESRLSLTLHRLRQPTETELDTDPLTGLPNPRKLFLQLEKELLRSSRSNQTLAVILCDLNDFRQVNDREGQLLGDKFLTTLATCLREGCRSYDTIARTGANQFLFLLPDTAKLDLSDRLASISHIIASARRTAGIRTEVSASLGSAFFPAEAATAEDLLALVDRRMLMEKDYYRKRRDEAHLAESA